MMSLTLDAAANRPRTYWRLFIPKSITVAAQEGYSWTKARADELSPGVRSVLARLGLLAHAQVADSYEDAITVAAVAAEKRASG